MEQLVKETNTDSLDIYNMHVAYIWPYNINTTKQVLINLFSFKLVFPHNMCVGSLCQYLWVLTAS